MDGLAIAEAAAPALMEFAIVLAAAAEVPPYGKKVAAAVEPPYGIDLAGADGRLAPGYERPGILDTLPCVDKVVQSSLNFLFESITASLSCITILAYAGFWNYKARSIGPTVRSTV